VRNDFSNKRMDLVEPSGFGGIYQHVVELALIGSGIFEEIVLHTASEAEFLAVDWPRNVRICGCTHWFRTFPKAAQRLLRPMAFLGFTIPHLLKQLKSRPVVHLHGCFQGVMLLTQVFNFCRVGYIFSPHNVFKRKADGTSTPVSQKYIQGAEKIAVYSISDQVILANRKINSVLIPLVQYLQLPSDEAVHEKRQMFGSDLSDKVALIPGQIRHDKDYQLAVDAVAKLDGWQLVIAGEDLGGLDDVDLSSYRQNKVMVFRGYMDFNELCAVMMASDVILAPYTQASGSGVLSLAQSLGVVTVASKVGGLGDFADLVVENPTPTLFAEAIAASRKSKETLFQTRLDFDWESLWCT